MNQTLILGVVGSGSMGSGIAQIAAQHGAQVRIYDSAAAALEKAREQIEKNLQQLAAKGKISPETAEHTFARIQFVGELNALSDCQLVIEAIVENLPAKQQLFTQIEELVADSCILASNTSSLSITSIAAACRLPERVVGLHFFNPATLMKLVEVIPALQTHEGVTAAAKNIVEQWGKTSVLAKDTPAFIVNRIARPFYSEALRLLEEGIADSATIDWAMKQIGGFRMGPFELMDFIGNDVNFTVTESTFQAFYGEPRYKPSFTQKRLVEAGFLGKKSGRGFYHYTAAGAEIPAVQENYELGGYIAQRIIMMLINEAADAVFWQVASPPHIDLAMTLGVNYPKGLLAWANEAGIAECVRNMDVLYDDYREDRYRCSFLLRKMSRNQENFEL
ncbi:MAG: 3-hydroxybutyryl-CoA dehydrogenase [Sphingobacteriales bacterium]|nr:3-hydroxybutyryl-CoA dehydrogenase [Sphingobacteriales bacterium]